MATTDDRENAPHPALSGPRADEGEALLAFWYSDETRAHWFSQDDAFDQTLRERFGALHEAAKDGALDEWSETPRGSLALVLLLDQLPRNLHRNDGRAFACDGLARYWTRRAVARGQDVRLETGFERLFLYMPLMHSEQLSDQDDLIALLHARGPSENLPFAHKHRDLIARFGRFPHRNEELGRRSTPDERAFLSSGSRGF